MRIFILLFALITFCSEYSFSQKDTTNKKVSFIIKTDILFESIGLISDAKIASLTFEACFNHRQSAQITALYNSYNGQLLNGIDQSPSDPYKIVQIISEYKFFVQDKMDYTGFYLGADLKWMNYNYTYIDFSNDVPGDTTKYDWNIISGGLILGYQNYIKKKFTYDFLVGWGYSYVLNSTIVKPSDFVDGYSFNTDLRLAIDIGYRF